MDGYSLDCWPRPGPEEDNDGDGDEDEKPWCIDGGPYMGDLTPDSCLIGAAGGFMDPKWFGEERCTD